jgi:hypothetical protein
MVLYWVLTFAMSATSRLQSDRISRKAGFKTAFQWDGMSSFRSKLVVLSIKNGGEYFYSLLFHFT